MSRSYRKTPFFGHTTAVSEKADKTYAHHVERVQARVQLAKSGAADNVQVSSNKHAFSNSYTFAKDGKSYSKLRVRREGRALQVLHAPRWLKSVRDVHQALGK